MVEFQQSAQPNLKGTSSSLPGQHVENASGRSLSWSRDCAPGHTFSAGRRGRLSSASLQDLSRVEEGWLPAPPYPRQLHCCRQHCRPDRIAPPDLWPWLTAVPTPGRTMCAAGSLRTANCGDLFTVELDSCEQGPRYPTVRTSGCITTEV
jgi:hypothetical protein